MTYRSLLVYLDQDPHCDVRTRMAIDMARRFDSHLCGIAPTGLVDMPTSLEGAATLVAYADHAFDDLRALAMQATQRFAQACIDGGLQAFDTLVDDGDRETSLTRRAHCSDLTIVGQAEPDIDRRRDARDVVERHVFLSARPTLVCPYAGCGDSVAQRVLVAWDGSRESTRAMADALPLLRKARAVRVACWAERGLHHEEAMSGRLESLHQWLERRGVHAQMHLESTDIDVCQAMLSRVADWGSDLIVMGAYGRSRLAERVMGGASKGILASMTVPVMMSH